MQTNPLEPPLERMSLELSTPKGRKTLGKTLLYVAWKMYVALWDGETVNTPSCTGTR